MPTNTFSAVHRRHEYELGSIISFNLHETHSRQDGPLDRNSSISALNDRVISKHRKGVVVQLCAEHVIVALFYTNKSTKTEDSPELQRQARELISIREIGFRATADPPETNYGTLWADRLEHLKGKEYSDWIAMTNTTRVHFAKLHCHSYRAKCSISTYSITTSLVGCLIQLRQASPAKLPLYEGPAGRKRSRL